MTPPQKLAPAGFVQENLETISGRWAQELAALPELQANGVDEQELQRDAREFLQFFLEALQKNDAALDSIDGEEWDALKSYLREYTAARLRQGFGPNEVALHMVRLKRALIETIRESMTETPDIETLFALSWKFSETIDRLALLAIDVFSQERESVIRAQEKQMLELSTPVIQLWEGILALPLIGTLDSERTQVVMEALLSKIVAHRASIAILDITGVPTVDTLTAQHLLKTVAAAKLMGADCIISGIRPQIAQTIVQLGIDLSSVMTKATLAGAFRLALRRRGLVVQSM